MATRADLITAVMENLNEISPGETVSAEDSVKVGRSLDNVVAGYSIDGLHIDTTSIPDYIFEELTAVVSPVAAPGFEKPEAEIQRLFLVARVKDRLVRNRLGPQRGHEPIEATYF